MAWRIALVVLAWFLAVGRSPCAVGDEPVPLPVMIYQSSYIAQAEESGSSAPSSEPVDCETLVQYALANNPEIQAARYRAQALGARVPQVASLDDPQLMTTVFLESIQTAAGPQDVVMSLSQRFPWFGKRGLRSDAAYHESMAAYARLAEKELKVVEEVNRAYLDLYFFQSAVAETGRLRPQLEIVIEIARTRYETNSPGAGLESVLQAQIELSKLSTRVIRWENAVVAAQAELAGVLHLEPGTRFLAVSRLDRAEVAQTANLLVGLAEECQPRLDAYRREVCRDRSATELACRGYWPDVTLSFNWHEIGPDGLSPVADGRDAYSLGVGMNLPLSRTRLDAAVREARYKTAASVRRYAAARDRLRTEVQTLHAQFTEQDRTLSVLQAEILPRAGQMLELSVEAYRVGRLQFQQLIDVYRTLLDHRIDFHRRVAMRGQAVASLQRAVGCAVTAEPIEGASHSQ
jgi:outer membrane protein, heavy metal efflux system